MKAIRKTCTHTEGPLHDCAYVDAINALIPLARAAADEARAGGRTLWS